MMTGIKNHQSPSDLGQSIKTMLLPNSDINQSEIMFSNPT